MSRTDRDDHYSRHRAPHPIDENTTEAELTSYGTALRVLITDRFKSHRALGVLTALKHLHGPPSIKANKLCWATIQDTPYLNEQARNNITRVTIHLDKDQVNLALVQEQVVHNPNGINGVWNMREV